MSEKTSRKIDKYLDKLFKGLDLKYINSIFKMGDIDEKLIKELPTEYTSIAEGERRADLVAESTHGYVVNAEYESGELNKNKFFKSWDYCSRIHKYLKKNGKTGKNAKVKNYMICTSGIDKPYYDYHPTCGGRHRIYTISLKNIDGDKKLNIVENKIKNREKFDVNDMTFLMVAVLTDSSYKPHEILMKVVKLTNKIIKIQKEEEITLIDENTIKEIKYYQSNNCENLIEEKYQDKILEEIKMKNDFYRNAMKEGMKKGKVEGKKEVAKMMKEDGNKQEYIQKITGLTLNEIKSL